MIFWHIGFARSVSRNRVGGNNATSVAFLDRGYSRLHLLSNVGPMGGSFVVSYSAASRGWLTPASFVDHFRSSRTRR